MAMVQAVQPYLIWLRTTAQQSQQMAASTEAAAAAFTSVRSAVVTARTGHRQPDAAGAVAGHQPVREQHGGDRRNRRPVPEMWANNSAAMSRYQAASAQATTLPQFSSPLTIANPTGRLLKPAWCLRQLLPALPHCLDGVLDSSA